MTNPAPRNETATDRYNRRHAEALELLAKLTAALSERKPATANWSDVADLAHTVEHLAEAAAFLGVIDEAAYEALEIGAR